MSWKDIVHLTSDDLRAYRRTHKEASYMLLDVRQPEEYVENHLPGATLLPLMELEPRLLQLPSDRDLVFYCRTGSRSVAAASLAAEVEVTAGTVYNLLGGLVQWNGRTLPDYPKIEALGEETDPAARLHRAMDLEKGAFRFYHHVKETYARRPFVGVFTRLATAEIGHARLVYRFWKELTPQAPPFDAVFEQLQGDILEGGERLSDLLGRLERMEGDLCLNLMELAINIEYAAFDMYRTLAEKSSGREAGPALWSLAEQEKAHINAIAKAVGVCHR